MQHLVSPDRACNRVRPQFFCQRKLPAALHLSKMTCQSVYNGACLYLRPLRRRTDSLPGGFSSSHDTSKSIEAGAVSALADSLRTLLDEIMPLSHQIDSCIFFSSTVLAHAYILRKIHTSHHLPLPDGMLR